MVETDTSEFDVSDAMADDSTVGSIGERRAAPVGTPAPVQPIPGALVPSPRCPGPPVGC